MQLYNTSVSCFRNLRQGWFSLNMILSFGLSKKGIRMNEKIGLTVEEAAASSGIGRNTIRMLIDRGKLPVLKVGRKTIIRRDTLEKFMIINEGKDLLEVDTVNEVQ